MQGPEPTTLAVDCTQCGGALTLQFDETAPVRAPGREPPVQAYVCPYCFTRNEATFPALLKYVWKGHGRAGRQ